MTIKLHGSKMGENTMCAKYAKYLKGNSKM